MKDIKDYINESIINEDNMVAFGDKYNIQFKYADLASDEKFWGKYIKKPAMKKASKTYTRSIAADKVPTTVCDQVKMLVAYIENFKVDPDTMRGDDYNTMAQALVSSGVLSSAAEVDLRKMHNKRFTTDSDGHTMRMYVGGGLMLLFEITA